MTTKRRKTFVSVTAVLVALAILLTGTFAWVSISQEALNEKLEDSNPGGRLHDDYDGTNKDVYVENFGAAPIFARIRLDEYMEIGAGAGLKDGDEGYGTKSVTKVGNQAADINDTSTWTTHIPNADDTALCDKGFHDYIEWTMGGSTTYMPTFNKNKDSLKSDINGTFAGPDEDVNTKEDRYADYIDYSDPANASKTDDAVYDNDDNNVDEGDAAVEPDNITKKEETHEVQTTLDATVLTMEEWKAMGSPMGNYWVYDTDGWAYWALPIQPGKATGLLLDGLTEKDTPQERWYYAINVVAQFATAEDIDKLENTTPDAGKLLEQATNTTVVTGEDGKTYTGNNNYNEMTTNVFLLTVADLYGEGVRNIPATNPKDFTWSTERLTSDPSVLTCSSEFSYYWTRTCCGGGGSGSVNQVAIPYTCQYGMSFTNSTNTCYVRPALWVSSES